MRSANLFFFTQPQEMFEAWHQAQQNTPFEEKEEPFFVEFQQQPVSYGSVIDTSYQDSLYWKEQYLYGSSRLGIAKPELEVTNYKNSNFSLLTSNFKNYELTNHLGNVLATIKDEKQQIDQNADGIVDYYEPIVITANDYYPFGMVMPNRSFSLAGSGYRFGFNTQEKDDEVYGKGNLMTAEYWEYDARIGRRWNVDPVRKPFLSNYSVLGGNPIWKIDPDGDDDYYSENGKFLGSDFSKTNNARAIHSTVWQKVNSTEIQAESFSKMKELLTSELQNASKEIQFENAGKKFEGMWNAAKDGKERTGNFFYDFKNAKVTFEVDDKAQSSATHAEDNFPASKEVYLMDRTLISIGNVHTHQEELKYPNTSDNEHYNNQYGVSGGDGNTAKTNGSRTTIGAKNVDFHSAGGKDKSKNNVSSRKDLESGKYNAGKKALEDYGKNKK